MHLKSRTSLIGFALLGTCLLVGIFHRYVLTALAAPLVATGEAGPAEVALIGGGDHCYEVVAEQFQLGRHKEVLVFQSGQSRLVELEILPAGDELARQQLAAHDVPVQAVTALDPVVAGKVEPLTALRQWLELNSDRRVAAYCERFSSRRLRWVYDRELGSDLAQRIDVIALRDRRYSEGNWWKSKVGIKAFCDQWFLLCYGLRGNKLPAKAVLSADEYEAALFR